MDTIEIPNVGHFRIRAENRIAINRWQIVAGEYTENNCKEAFENLKQLAADREAWKEKVIEAMNLNWQAIANDNDAKIYHRATNDLQKILERGDENE